MPYKISAFRLQSFAEEKVYVPILNPLANSFPICSKMSIELVQTSVWTSISIIFYKVG